MGQVALEGEIRPSIYALSSLNRRSLLTLFLGVVWAAATTALIVDWPKSTAARVLAAIVVAAPTGYDYIHRVAVRVDEYDDPTRRMVTKTLQRALVAVNRTKAADDDEITDISFHVWALPLWYQLLLGFGPARHHIEARRKRLAERGRKASRLLEPRLRQVAMYKFGRHNPSGRKFRVGQGLIGRCIDKNRRNQAVTSALNRPQFQSALRDEDSWNDAPESISQNLTLRDAEHLAETYGQVAALVLRDGAYPIGCITLDLPPKTAIELTDDTGSTTDHPILEHLREARETVEDNLTTAR